MTVTPRKITHQLQDEVSILTEIFPWNDNFVTGIPRIDEQHRRLVDLVNLLAKHLAYQSNVGTLNLVFDELADYALHHFATEEHIWESYLLGDEEEAIHKRVHLSFAENVQKLKIANQHKALDEVIEEILLFLTQWLAYHILESDKRMAKIVLALQAGMSMSAAKRHAEEEMSGVTKVLIETILVMYEDLSSRTLRLMKEITERKKIEARLQLAANVFENTLDAVCITDAQVNIEDINPAFCDALQLPRAALLGKNLYDLKPWFVDAEYNTSLREAIGREAHWNGQIFSRLANGEREREWLTFSSIRDPQGQIANYVVVISNVRQLLQHQLHLERAANHDALTGLPNRVLLGHRLQHLLNQAKHTPHSFAVLFIDLDGFKPVNDQFGHETGDELLKVIGVRISHLLRRSDLVARVGGDEFVVLLSQIYQPKDCLVMLDRLLREIANPIRVDDNTAYVTASIGIALFPEHGLDAETLLSAADQAMYRAKEQGKSCYQFALPSEVSVQKIDRRL